jgi:hypothetical protein
LNVNTTAIVAPDVTVEGVNVAPDCPAFAAPGVTVKELLVALWPFAAAEMVKPVPALVTDNPLKVATPLTAFCVSVPRRSAPLLTVNVTGSSALLIFWPAEFSSSTETVNVPPAAPDAVGCVTKRSPATGVLSPPLIVPLPHAFAMPNTANAQIVDRSDLLNVFVISRQSRSSGPPSRRNR